MVHLVPSLPTEAQLDYKHMPLKLARFLPECSFLFKHILLLSTVCLYVSTPYLLPVITDDDHRMVMVAGNFQGIYILRMVTVKYTILNST